MGRVAPQVTEVRHSTQAPLLLSTLVSQNGVEAWLVLHTVSCPELEQATQELEVQIGVSTVQLALPRQPTQAPLLASALVSHSGVVGWLVAHTVSWPPLVHLPHA